MRILRFKRFWFILLLPFSVLLLHLASVYPAFVEQFYTQGFYRYALAGFLGRIFSLLPFSITGFTIAAALALAVARIAGRLRRKALAPMKIHKIKRKPDFLKIWATLCAGTGILYFVFAFFCGFNYHRLTFAQQSGLDVRPSSSRELADLCESLVKTANALRGQLAEDDSGVMELSASPMKLAATAQAVYANSAEVYPVLAGYVARPKPAVAPRAMSWMQISGIYIPFFFEPNVNTDIVDYNIPATMMHEMSHFKGYMRENEANFIAYLACKYSGNPEFTYSGAMMALIHSTNALYGADRDLYWEVMGSLSEKVWKDISANNQYWQQFEGPVAEVSTAVNDVYLRANKQESGVKSYGEMVDLLLAEFRA